MKCRNYVILALLKSRRRTVIHQKTNKAKRRASNIETKNYYG